MFNIINVFLNGLKVGRQVTIVTSISIMALAALAIVSYIEADGVARSNRDTSHASSKAHIFNKIYGESLSMRRYEKDYLNHFDPENIVKFNDAAKRALEDAYLFESIVDTPEELKRVKHIIVGLKMSKIQFEKVVELENQLGITPDAGIHGELRELTHDSEELLQEIQAQENNDPKLDILTVEMQMLHLDELGFMLHQDKKYLKDFTHGVELFINSINEANLTPAEKTTLTNMIKEYDTLFSKWSLLEILTKEEIKRFDTIFATIEPELVEYSALFDQVARDNIKNLKILEAAHDTEMLVIYGTVLAFILIIALMSWAVSRYISDKMHDLSGMMNSLAKGDLDTDIIYTKFKNEIGVMARSLLVFRNTANDNITREETKQARLAMEAKKAEELVVFVKEFRTISSEKLINVGVASDQLEKVSSSLMVSTDEIKQRSAEVKDNVGATSINITGVAAATEEMSVAVSEISAQAAASATIVNEAKGKTLETVEKIKALTDSAIRIEEVVKLIDEISAKTNLLALNATIEAARAGEAGRGFAVVANEVKSLAEQTGKATSEIAAQVNQIQTDGDMAAKTVAEMSNIMVHLSEASIGVAAAVEEQSAAIDEISSNVATASDLSQKSAKSMDKASESVTVVHSISDEVMQVANNMKFEVEALEGDITSFLHKINAA